MSIYFYVVDPGETRSHISLSTRRYFFKTKTILSECVKIYVFTSFKCSKGTGVAVLWVSVCASTHKFRIGINAWDQ